MVREKNWLFENCKTLWCTEIYFVSLGKEEKENKSTKAKNNTERKENERQTTKKKKKPKAENKPVDSDDDEMVLFGTKQWTRCFDRIWTFRLRKYGVYVL